MAKKCIEVDKAKMMAAMVKAESNGPMRTRSELYQTMADIYNETNSGKDLTAAVVYLRVKEWNWKPETPVGRRGLGLKGPMTEEQKQKMAAGKAAGGKRSKKEKFSSNPGMIASFERLYKVTPERYHPLIEQIKNGSRSAAVKLMCLECSSYVSSEVKHCVCNQCPLWAFRPFQVGSDDESVEIVETTESEPEVELALAD